jgi:four helix bundle protein
MLDYEKLDVYQCAVQHLAFVFGALPKLSALADQWRRAATAIPMNIGEAVGKPSLADRMNKFAIARGEAMECGVILDVVRMLAVVPTDELDRAKTLIVRIVEMLTKLCR